MYWKVSIEFWIELKQENMEKNDRKSSVRAFEFASGVILLRAQYYKIHSIVFKAPSLWRDLCDRLTEIMAVPVPLNPQLCLLGRERARERVT